MSIRKREKKNKLSKPMLTIIFIAILISLIMVMPNKVFADTFGGDVASITAADTALTALYIATGGVALIGLYQIKLVVVVVGWVLQVLGAAVIGEWGIEGIIFSGIPKYANSLVSINVFNNIGKLGTLGAFSAAVAKWYYIIRFISAAILLVILIYVGIRMALATVGKEQAKYKEWLVNWLVSMALLFFLHYIMVVTFAVNDALVSMIYSLEGDDVITTAEMMGVLTAENLLPGIIGILACVCFAVMSLQIFSFIFMYIKRLITVSFLIMISPLICVTYSIDKIGDGKSQALNEWLKQFIYNVLIQPFHCIIYVALLTTAYDVSAGRVLSTSGYILAIFILLFMKNAEKILREIFHFHQGVGGIGEAGQAMMNATGKVASIGAAAGAGIINYKNSGGFDKMKANLDFKARSSAKADFKEQNPDAKFKDKFKYKASGQYAKDIEKNHVENVRKRREEIDRKKFEKVTGDENGYDNIQNEASAEIEKEEKVSKAKQGKEYGSDGTKTYEEAKTEIMNDQTKTEKQKTKALEKLDENVQNVAQTMSVDKTSNDFKGKVSERTHQKVADTVKDCGYIGTAKHGVAIKGLKSIPVGKKYRQYTKDIGMEKFSDALVLNGLAAMAGMAFAGGQGSMQGFHTGYQAVSGFMKPILKNSASTLEEDGATRIQKVRECCPELANLSTEEIMKYLKSLDESGLRDSIGNKKGDIKDLAQGIFDARKLSDPNYSGSVESIRSDLNGFIGELQSMLQNDKIGSFDLATVAKKLAEKHNLSYDGDLQSHTVEMSNLMAMLNGKQQVAQAESVGYKISYYAERCDKKDSNVYEEFTNSVTTSHTSVSFETGTNGEIEIDLRDLGMREDEIDTTLLKFDKDIGDILYNFDQKMADEDATKEMLKSRIKEAHGKTV